MKSITETVLVGEPRDVVFDFLSKEENLPFWATEYCSGARLEGGRWIIQTSCGPMIARHDADARTGVIDMYSGPSDADLALFPVRVLALPDGRTAVSLTFFQTPDLPDELFARQHASLRTELSALESVVREHRARPAATGIPRR